jgi:hypothetical protein
MRAIAVKPFLALALFVARVGAQDSHDAFAPHDLAVLTNFLNRSPNLHFFSVSFRGMPVLAHPVTLVFLAHPVRDSAAG